MKNIMILAAGPPKPDRDRHLQIFEGEKLIDRIISKCMIDGTVLYVVVNKNNHQLIDHVDSIDNVFLLTPEDDTIRSTFETSLSVDGDCIMVAGDLVDLRDGDIQRFVDSEFKSATCRYKKPWGADVLSVDGTMRRRADVGDCINMICEGDKERFLSESNYDLAK